MLSVPAHRRAIYPLRKFLSPPRFPARPTASQHIVPWRSRRITLVRRPHPHLTRDRFVLFVLTRNPPSAPSLSSSLRRSWPSPHVSFATAFGFRIILLLEGIPDPAPRDDAESPTRRSPVERRLLPSSGTIPSAAACVLDRDKLRATQARSSHHRASNDVAPHTSRQKERWSSRGGRSAAPCVASAGMPDVRRISGL
ncbi:hypothetical protein B0H13DRAFT_2053317 [Mycena leptocephala]|nr:hypothetical protein B0H13DRAFT_2053317 [Mycena leptocephala]